MRYDKDGNRKLTVDEMREAQRQYWASYAQRTRLARERSRIVLLTVLALFAFAVLCVLMSGRFHVGSSTASSPVPVPVVVGVGQACGVGE